MGNAKIEFAFGSLNFSGEGEAEWVGQQLDKILEAAPTLSNLQPPQTSNSSTSSSQSGGAAGGSGNTGGAAIGAGEPLANYIKAKGGESNQNKRFLATADWLRLRGIKPLTTAAVSKALSDNHQKKVGNPADCLNQNVGKGYCEKTSDGFYITPHGLKSLGHSE